MNPIVEKLKFSKYSSHIIFNLPSSINVFDGLSYDTNSGGSTYDFILAFVYSLDEMKTMIQTFYKDHLLSEKGILLFAYPKLKNRIIREGIHRDAIFPFLGVDDATGFVPETNYRFNKMVSFDEDYTIIGLRIGKDVSSKRDVNFHVDTHIENIPRVQDSLKQYPTLLDFYNNLTPGYQKDWARFVFSAKTEATQEKRIQEMIVILGLGFKSKNLYDQSKKK